ncbi:arabinan endo-1,5-alpha-L-arabinosidase [Streptosporangium sp. NPDC050855]|uniref:arabinan endo-1,5-alpha-L-arabinosidase n=1 Tax=Streptosporangium sp. NPDC050855 TaxID=3366194 RepID=UPI0037888DDB
MRRPGFDRALVAACAIAVAALGLPRSALAAQPASAPSGAVGVPSGATAAARAVTRAVGTSGSARASVPGAAPVSGAAGTSLADYPGPGRVTGDVLVHDPSMVKKPDGTYLLVHTADGIGIKTSADRTAFRNAGVVWPNGAPWTTAYTGGSRNLWAPDLSYRNGRYHLYYSASTFGSSRSAIFLATSTTGASGSWTDRGLVIETTADSGYNAIDPNLVVDDQGRWWLSFGSFWSGIKMIRLDPATGKRSSSDTSVRALAQRTTASGAVEAPFVHRRGGYYYLFVSFDLCCRGAQSTYRTMVGRSTSVTGPFVDRNGTRMTSGGGTEILAGHGSVHGPGHPAVMPDADGDLLVYHYYADDGSARLGVNLLGWDSAGWPYVH